MKAVTVAVLAILALVCVSAQTENPECDSLRAKIQALRATKKEGELASVEAKVNEYKERMKALQCKRIPTTPTTRETENPECAVIRDKLRSARVSITDKTERDAKVKEYTKRLDALKCVKRSTPLPGRETEHKECESLRAKIRALRATTGTSDKETRDKKVAEYKARMDLLKCVNRPRNNTNAKEDPECQSIRTKIRLIRSQAQPGEKSAVEKKVKEYVERLKALKCNRIVRPITRETEDPKCRSIRAKIRVARLTIRNKKELEAKEKEYKRQLDALKCAKRSVEPEERRNEHKECSSLRAKIRSIRATSNSTEDRAAVEKKVAEYKARMEELKCVQVRQPSTPGKKCVVSGCNKEVCSDRPQTTPCVYRPEYKCFRYAKCGNFGTNGSCEWQKTPEFYQCSGEKKMWI